jgi:alanine dehydrogenase
VPARLHQAARDFAARIAEETGFGVEDVDDLGAATCDSDTIVTCTSAREAFLGQEHIRPGTFIAAVGADNPAKSELKPGLMAKASVYVDVLEQACIMGDLHHAIAGAMRADQVQGNLGQLVSGEIHGRRNDNEIIIFDSTGTGVQDVAAAARAYELARDRGIGLVCTLA